MADNDAPNYPITSADNVLRVLLMLREDDTLRVTDVAESIGVAHSTAHRLLAMLVYRRLVHHNPTRRTYHPGVELVTLAHAVLRHNTLGEIAQPILASVAADLDETTHLTVLHGSEVMFVAVAEGTQSVRAADRTGTTLPSHLSAAGRALLAGLSTEDVHSIVKTIESSGVDVDEPALQNHLIDVRSRGFAVNRGETEPELWAVASPVKSGGIALASITVGCPVSRADEAWVERAGATVVVAAATLSDRLERNT